MIDMGKRIVPYQEMALVFASIVFLVHIWSITSTLQEIPAWRLRFKLWDLIGAMAYAQVIALIESLAILLALVILASVLPTRFFRDRFVARGFVLTLVTMVWLVPAHFIDEIWFAWGAKDFLLWSALYALSMGIVYLLIHRVNRLDGIIALVLDRLLVLAAVYVFIDLVSVVIVISRNI